MKITTRETDTHVITESHTERWCPLLDRECLADRCAMSLHEEDTEATIVYCGLVRRDGNRDASWVKEVYREHK